MIALPSCELPGLLPLELISVYGYYYSPLLLFTYFSFFSISSYLVKLRERARL